MNADLDAGVDPNVDVDVLIVGAGPVGMLGGILASRHGLSSLVVERRGGLQTSPAAHVVNARTFEICRQAGLDMDRMKGDAPRDHEPRTHGIANASQHVVWGWRTLPVPVIAAVQGVAYGGGCQLALGPDIRYLAPDARMSIMEIKWGLVPDMAGTPIMPGLVRDDLLRELCFTARILSATEALQVGFATRIYDDPRQAALETAREIAGKNPDAVRAMKRMFNNMTPDPASALMAESVEQMKLLGSANQREAVKANFEKRSPVFTNSQ